MFSHRGLFHRTIGASVAGLTLFALLLITPLRYAAAADLAEQAHSLKVVPADVSFYSASLRLKEQLDIFLASKAYAKLLEIPLVQLGKMQATFQWQQSSEPTVAEFREYIQSPEGQDAVAVLKEMFSEEIFAYGGDDIAQALNLVMQLNTIQRTARIEAQATDQEFEDVMAERTRQLFEQNADSFKVPTLVLGFRIKDAERAAQQLDEVHAHLRNLLDQNQPELSAHLQRDQIAGSEFLTLRLDGSMIPWDKLREQTENVNEEQFEQWREMLSDKTIAIALGVVDEYVLLSIADSTDHLETFGQGGNLAEQAAIERLTKHADERLVSISYVSETLATSMNSAEKTKEDLAGTADEILRQAEVSDEKREEIVADIRSMDLARYMPEPGESSGVQFLTKNGYEGYRYQTGIKPMSDSSKPLSILEYVGGSPLLFVASRSNDTVEDYDQAVDWLRRMAGHVEEIVETKADADDWARYTQYRERILDLLRRINEANREHLYPALADNQGAIVVDTEATSEKWFEQMPTSPKPLPMVEVAIVASVSDAEHLRTGVTMYSDVVRDAVKLMKEMNPEDIPQIRLEKPEQRGLDGGGTVYYYPLPEAWGVDSKLALNAGLTDSAAAMSTMPSTTERLLSPESLDVKTSLDFSRPAAMAVYFDFGQTIAALRPWINYGLDVAMGNIKPDDEDEAAGETPPEQSAMMMQMGFIVPQIQQFLDVAAAFQSASSITYEEDDLWVTHSETRFQDLK